jgi:hypothetical protein
MGKPWPTISGNSSTVSISQGATTPTGTILTKSARRPVKFMAGGQFGLLELSTNSYRAVQLWVVETLTPHNYRQIWTKNVADPDDPSYTYIVCQAGERLNLYPEIHSLEPGPHVPLSSDSNNRVVCKDFLYHIDVGGKSQFDHTNGPFYYRENETFVVYPDEYQRLSTAQAQTWIQTTQSRQYASTVTSLGDLKDRQARLLPEMRATMQSVLSQDATYANIMRLVGNDRNDPRVRNTARQILNARGYSDSNVAWFFNPLENPGTLGTLRPASGGSASGSRGGGSGGGSGSGVSRPNTFIAPTPAVTRVVVRAPFGYSRPPDRAPDQRPQIIQNYTEYVRSPGFSGGYREVSGQDIFVFPYVPNNISYSGLGSQWTEIDRQGNYPLVEWTKWDLMRVEMEFLLAEERTESGGAIVPDGIFNSVQGRLNTLRRMSQRRAAVSVFNLDDLFRVQIKRAAETGKAMQFVIADLTVNASRRSLNSVSKEITAATVKLTLQEIPIEAVTIVRMSPPKMTDPTLPKKTDEDSESSDVLFTDIWSAKPLT